MTDSVDLAAKLREHGHKVTRQRTEVWDSLLRAPGHLTAEEVAAGTASQVNLASVYRALGLFTAIGIARESKLGNDDASRWELAHPDDEFHLVCSNCDSVQHHGGDLVAQIRDHLHESHGFAASAIEISVGGLCGKCA